MVRLWGPLPGSFLGQMEENTAIKGYRGKREQWSGGCKRHLKYSCWGCTPWAFLTLSCSKENASPLFHQSYSSQSTEAEERLPGRTRRRPLWLVFPAWTSPSSDVNLRAASSLAPPCWAGVTYSLGFLPMIPTTYLNHMKKVFHPSLKNNKQKCDDWELIEIYLSQKRLNALKVCMCGYKCTPLKNNCIRCSNILT